MNDFGLFEIDPVPDLPNFPEMDNSVLEHATGNTQGSYSTLVPLPSAALDREPLSTILAFMADDTLPVLESFPEMDNSV